MALKQREIVTIAIGGAIVLVGAIARLAPAMTGSASANSLAGMLGRMDSFNQLRQNVERRQKDLGIELPRVDPAEQEVQIREKLGKLVQSSGLKLGRLGRLERSSRSSAGETSADFQFDAAGQYDQVVKFIAALETDTMPFKVQELRIEAGGGGEGEGGGGNRGGGGERQTNGQVKASFKVRGYLFPKVFLDPEKAGKKSEAGPEKSESKDRGENKSQQPTTATLEVKTSETTKVKTEVTPSPEKPDEAETPRKKGRTVIRWTDEKGSHEATIEGNTATFEGQTRELTDEELANWRNELPPGAEVTEE